MTRLAVPEGIRESLDKAGIERKEDGSAPSFTWIIEITSQVIFSMSAAVHFELLVSRDEKSLELGFASLNTHAAATPGQLEDHQQTKRNKDGHHSAAQPKGVYSHAVKLVVDDTTSLWNKPSMPEWSDDGRERGVKPRSSGLVSDGATAGRVDVGEITPIDNKEDGKKPRKRKRVHLVVLTHGLHSNLGADMLYLKESIDATAKKAREDIRKKKREARELTSKHWDESAVIDDQPDSSTAPLSGGQDELDPNENSEDDDDEEEVIVRGFPGNACRTEKGIQYLGKRLAKWILSMTYPDQPFLPAKKSIRKKITRVLSGDGPSAMKNGTPEHKHSSIYKPAEKKPENLAYKITSISFIAHSLGGLTQTYAIAYIHKHSPHFFDDIKPINFVAMAAPFLGLSNENPLYVKFALDFGLVGRTGQDLGLAWKSTTALRGGWDSMIAGIGNDGQRAQKQPDPGSKPLLRILPTGHTHQVLKLFRNRTVYSNVVNDGIVPLRTSCLLFLDWSGLGRVEKARRDNGIVSGLAGWGWAELTGANASARHLRAEPDSDAWSQSNVSCDGTRSRSRSQSRRPSSQRVPQPEENVVKDENAAETPENSQSHQFLDGRSPKSQDEDYDANEIQEPSAQQPTHPMSGFLSLFRPSQSKKHHHSPKQSKIYKRGQIVKIDGEGAPSPPEDPGEVNIRPSTVRGDSVLDDPNNVFAPPKTTIFESAGDILNPPMPCKEFIIDPKSRPRTIFHDRVYHPEDIPPPRAKRPSRLTRSISSESKSGPSPPHSDTVYGGPNSTDQTDTSGMKVEEKIARAYHHGLSWRKVLVRLEPDAHNNMVVRRMFSNAYGWPVIKHLVDTHFADTYEATTADRLEPSAERAKPVEEAVGTGGEEVKAIKEIRRTDSEAQEAKDEVPELKKASGDSMSSAFSGSNPSASRKSSVGSTWDDILFEGSDDDDDDIDGHNVGARQHSMKQHHSHRERSGSGEARGTSDAEIQAFLDRKPTVLNTTGNIIEEGGLVASPKSATSLGLGKSIEEQIARARETDVGTINDREAGERGQSEMAKIGESEVPDLSALQVENGH